MRTLAALAFTLFLLPRAASAQEAGSGGSEATGLGVGAQAMLTNLGTIDLGAGMTVDVPGLVGPAVVYQTPAFHIDGIISYYSDGITALGAGGRFWYKLHSTQASDFSLGGGIGFLNVDFGPDSTTLVEFEAGAQVRAFLAPAVALSASAGLGIISGDFDLLTIGGQLVGSIGVTYFFF